ncbi:MAG: DEAD/DEAH box helicase [Armatimonadetes bacterium]|nr:DEAD/DEAH box helicase [Armatimonadota bacterium]
MKLKGRFIGIDKFAHAKVSDLTGARRDATALAALFADSLPEADCKLVTDHEATSEKVRECLNETLRTADSEDTVVFFFAGHGSSSHRLVCHNSDPGNFLETSVGMDEIAEMFRQSKARVALCILDCCFSGGAPARVFSELAVPRSSARMPEFTGEGRLLITASDDNESAFEDPVTRHGLFTKALLSAFQSGEQGADLTALLSNVLNQVRADAIRLGVVQTPQLAGSVKGGLGLPKMRAGTKYRAAFPELSERIVTQDIRELNSFGIPASVVSAWHERMPNGLSDMQLEAVNSKRILDGKSLLVVAPTSSGKTLVGEMAAAKAAADGRKTVFLLPYKALANEKYDQFKEVYKLQAGQRVIRCTGDSSDQASEILKGKYEIALLTYEMFLNLAVSNPSMLHQVGLVVLDEAQFITDPNRGMTVELLLTLLLSARQHGLCPQLICLSAVIGNLNSFDEWLGCEKLVTEKRPVELLEGVIGRDGVFMYRGSNGETFREQIVQAMDIHQRGQKPSAQDVIVPVVRKLVADEEQVIVFRNQRGSAQGCAKYLAADLGFPPAARAIEELPEGDLSAASVDLRSCLEGGTAFHTSDLTREERSIVERAFRDKEGGVKALGATTTVAAGVNTPASTVIIAEHEFIGEETRSFTVAEYKNMAGRAGRLGFNEKGKSMIYASTPSEQNRLFEQYVCGVLEPIQSSFDPKHLDTWVLRLFAQVVAVPREQVTSLLANTYGGYLAAKRDSTWRKWVDDAIEQIIERMLNLEILELHGNSLSLTLLGKACGKSALSFESSLRLVALVKGVPPHELTPERMMVLVQALPELDASYTPMFKRGTSENVRPQQAAQRFGVSSVHALQRRARDSMEYYARCKRAAVLGAWIDGLSVEMIESTFSSNRYSRVSAGPIRSIADLTRLYLRPAADIAVLVQLEAQLDPAEMDRLMARMEFGVPASVLELIANGLVLDRGALLALHAAGATSIESLGEMDGVELERIVGRRLVPLVKAIASRPR